MSSAWPVAVAAGWHPLAQVADLGRKPLARVLMGEPLVVFAGSAGPAVLRDRCPHRGMPLSFGRVRAGTIACPYHGWRFGADGRCVEVPGADIVPEAAAGALPAVVRAGLVWTSLAAAPAAFPQLPPAIEDAALDRFWWPVAPSRAGLLDAIENHLDPAHPHFLHPWLVRSPARRRPMRVHVCVNRTGARAVYEEVGRAGGWMPRLLEGNRLRSIGHYYPPTIAEAAFEGTLGLSLSVTVVFVPEREGVTRPWAHFATRRGLASAWLKRWLLMGCHLPILRQDRQALARQAEAAAAADDARHAIGPLDLLGPAIWRLVNGELPDEQRYERTIWL